MFYTKNIYDGYLIQLYIYSDTCILRAKSLNDGAIIRINIHSFVSNDTQRIVNVYSNLKIIPYNNVIKKFILKALSN